MPSYKSGSWRRHTCINVLLVCLGCLEVCFVGPVVGRIYVWCLVIFVLFMGFGQAGAKRWGECLKVINWGWRCNSKKGDSFHREGRSHYVILMYWETFLQVLVGIYCKRFSQIPLFTILLLFSVSEFG